MYICTKGGRGGIYSFPVPIHLFFSRKGTYVGFPFLHLLLQVSLDFRGGVFFCTASFSLRFNLPFFPSGSLSSHDRPQRGQEVGLVAKRTGTNSPDPRVWLDGVDRVVGLEWTGTYTASLVRCLVWWWLILTLGPKTVTFPTERRGGLDWPWSNLGNSYC